MKTLNFTAVDVHKGHLVLVNPSHPVMDTPAGGSLANIGTNAASVLLERQAARMLEKVRSLMNDSDEIVAVSGYRTMEEQQTIYRDCLKEHGRAFTEKYVAIPGCSEHQTGLAVDLAENKGNIDFIRPHFPYTGICQTFREMSVQYGFIQRYPEGKQQITQIAHEPWHFRYVGFPHSQLMKEQDYTLEQYTDYLKGFQYRQTHMKVRYEWRSFEIFYIPVQVSGTVEVAIPDKIPFQVSGNNEDGVVVTLWGEW